MLSDGSPLDDPRLDYLLTVADWTERAACNGIANPNIFFSIRKKDQRAAKALCAVCQVRAECAIEGAGQVGIWAGEIQGSVAHRAKQNERLR